MDAPSPDASLAAADAAAARRLLAAGFARAGVRRGAVLLAHSSLSSFGRVAGGADTVIDAAARRTAHAFGTSFRTSGLRASVPRACPAKIGKRFRNSSNSTAT